MGEKEQEFFHRVPGLLDAIQQTAKKGFFAKFKGEVEEHGKNFSVIIEGRGYIPAQPQYQQSGIGIFMDPNLTMDRLGDLIRQREPKFQVQYIHSETKTGTWPLYDETQAEAKVIGNKGLEITFSFTVLFEPRTSE